MDNKKYGYLFCDTKNTNIEYYTGECVVTGLKNTSNYEKLRYMLEDGLEFSIVESATIGVGDSQQTLSRKTKCVIDASAFSTCVGKYTPTILIGSFKVIGTEESNLDAAIYDEVFARFNRFND